MFGSDSVDGFFLCKGRAVGGGSSLTVQEGRWLAYLFRFGLVRSGPARLTADLQLTAMLKSLQIDELLELSDLDQTYRVSQPPRIQS
jgi:hypothetical protein